MNEIASARRIVIKVGSALLVAPDAPSPGALVAAALLRRTGRCIAREWLSRARA